jgi:hypothetical protein
VATITASTAAKTVNRPRTENNRRSIGCQPLLMPVKSKKAKDPVNQLTFDFLPFSFYFFVAGP